MKDLRSFPDSTKQKPYLINNNSSGIKKYLDLWHCDPVWQCKSQTQNKYVQYGGMSQ